MPYCPSCQGTFESGKFCPKDGTRLLPDRPDAQAQTGGAPAEETDPLVGQVVAGRFRIVSTLGTGGMGSVYLAQHLFIDKRVALKLLKPEIISSPEAVARFQREAMAASTIGHQNIVTIDDFGRLEDDQVYLTMEYLEGLPLNKVIAQGPMPLDRILDLAIQTCEGLAAAHDKGIVHRDMKPENIFLVRGGSQVKILDFGIAKVTLGDTQTNLTKTGAVFGTPSYMSPEQAMGKGVDHRADIYAMGIMLYEMVTGVVPFQSESFVAVLTQHVTKEPLAPSEVAPERGIPPQMEALVLRAIAKNPEQRFQDARELLGALEQVRQDCVVPAPPTVISGQPAQEPAAPRTDPTPPTVVAAPVQAADATPVPVAVPVPTPAPARTTATASAGELIGVEGRPRRRTGLVLGLLGLAVLGGGGGALAVFLANQPGDAPPLAAAGQPQEVGRPDPPAPADEEQKADPAPEEKPAPRPVKVKVITVPSRVTVVFEGKERGKSPRVLQVLAGEPVKLLLRRKGYQQQEVEFTVDRDQEVEFTLKRLPRRPPRGRKKPPPTKPRPAGEKKPPGPDESDHGKHSHEPEVQPPAEGSSHDEVMVPGGYRRP